MQEAIGNAESVIAACYACGESLAGVAGSHLAGLLRAVERQRVSPDVLAPKGFFKSDLQSFRLPLQGIGAFGQAQAARARGGEALCCVHIPLYLDERDWPLRQSAVCMKNRVVRILPALVCQASLGSAYILDEAVAIAVAVFIHPRERALDRRP